MPDKFGKEALEAHNRYRSLHQAPPLKWSRSLEKDAEKWAKQLAKEGGRLRHEETDDGENVYAISGKSDVTGGEVVDRWYAEVDNYDFRSPGFKSGTGHFTQIVWQESTEFGIGKAKVGDDKVIVVARYRPPGNVINHFQNNVNPKLGSSVTNRSRERDSRDSSTRPEPRREIDDSRRSSSRQEKTETITYDRDGVKTTVTRTVITDGEREDQFDRFPRDMRRAFDDGPFKDKKERWEQNEPFKDRMDKWERNAQPTSYSTSWSSQKPKETRPADRFSPSASATSSPAGSFAKQSLDSHNKYRAMHGVPAMKWADDLAREAQAWAEKLARARTLQHSSKSERKDAGENLAYFTERFDSAGEEATTMWYDEYKDYDFRRGGWQGGTGHFTQVVWKGSKELGMGRAKTSDGRGTFVVGRYRPAGNVINYMQDNVFPRRGR